MLKQQCRNTKNFKNQGSMPSPKDINNSPTAEPKVPAHCNLSDKEFKIAVLKKLNKLQEELKTAQDIRKRIH